MGSTLTAGYFWKSAVRTGHMVDGAPQIKIKIKSTAA